jgi:hypothetical protein
VLDDSLYLRPTRVRERGDQAKELRRAIKASSFVPHIPQGNISYEMSKGLKTMKHGSISEFTCHILAFKLFFIL